jgi:hypothetical protein
MGEAVGGESVLFLMLPLNNKTAHNPTPNTTPKKAEKTSRKAGLADRLVNGLSGENRRWSETIRRLEARESLLVGDALLAAAFVSYAGPFNAEFRQQLVAEAWLPDIAARGIPISQGAYGVFASCDFFVRVCLLTHHVFQRILISTPTSSKPKTKQQQKASARSTS